MPEIVAEAESLRHRLRQVRSQGASIGFVPTMGALHAGHAKLLRTARRDNDYVVASIFVNPLQFDRGEDLERYPRTFDADVRLSEACGVDLIFAPTAAGLYPQEQLTFVESPKLEMHLCGAHRPAHFRGVATVVLKLFNLVQPDRAYFGEKDAQQLVVIRRMVQDLNVPVTVVPVATVREPDGLALSSRNKHLSAAERQIAPILYRALSKARDLLNSGEKSVSEIQHRIHEMFAACPQVRLEYFELTDPDTLEPVSTISEPVLIAGAVWLGSTRLIDNISWPTAP